jgi:hypothetical protein
VDLVATGADGDTGATGDDTGDMIGDFVDFNATVGDTGAADEINWKNFRFSCSCCEDNQPVAFTYLWHSLVQEFVGLPVGVGGFPCAQNTT